MWSDVDGWVFGLLRQILGAVFPNMMDRVVEALVRVRLDITDGHGPESCALERWCSGIIKLVEHKQEALRKRGSQVALLPVLLNEIKILESREGEVLLGPPRWEEANRLDLDVGLLELGNQFFSLSPRIRLVMTA